MADTILNEAIVGRYADESDLDYLVRLSRHKDEYGLSWADIVLLTGDTRATDSIRKWWRDFSSGVSYATQSISFNDSELNDEELDAIEQKKIELQKERIKRQTINGQINKIVREDARRELLFEQIRESIGRVTPPIFNDIAVNVGKREAILGFGDIHFGKEFEIKNNRYNEAIFHERMEKLMAETLSIVKKESLDHLHVLNAGDSLEGIALRVSQLMALQYGMVDSTIRFSRYMVEWLSKLSKDVKLTYHHVRSANHPELRPLGTSAGQFVNEDMERVIHMYIHDMLQDNKRITVPDYKETYVDFSVCGYNVIGIHGHGLKSSVENFLKGITMQHRKFYDYCYSAHLHHGKEVTVNVGTTNNVEVLQLPSIMGGDEYSDSLLTGAKPGAKIHLFQEGRGKTIGYDIIL